MIWKFLIILFVNYSLIFLIFVLSQVLILHLAESIYKRIYKKYAYKYAHTCVCTCIFWNQTPLFLVKILPCRYLIPTLPIEMLRDE